MSTVLFGIPVESRASRMRLWSSLSKALAKSMYTVARNLSDSPGFCKFHLCTLRLQEGGTLRNKTVLTWVNFRKISAMVFSIIFSQTLDMLQRSDIGLYFFTSDRSVSLRIGVISDFFQKVGKHRLL